MPVEPASGDQGMVRRPAVAGRFYAADPGALSRDLDRFLARERPPSRAIGVVAPHAGYVYSGAIAGAVYARIEIPPRVVVLGPNHTGLGALAALWPGGRWRLPTGDVTVDAGLTAALASGCPLLALDPEAHRLEHSLEVQVPFLARLRPDVSIAALCLGPLSLAECERVGRAIAAAVRSEGALVVASSDMSHYLPVAEAREKDALAIERMLALDAPGLYEVVRRERITMCGVIPATAMLFAAVELGASRAELVRYGSSGDVNGDVRRVVGYAGLVVA